MRKFLLSGLLIFCAPMAFAHGGHNGDSLTANFSDLVREGFYLKTLPATTEEAPYVVLADGSRYELDSKFWQATQDLAEVLAEHVGPNMAPRERGAVANGRRLAYAIGQRLRNLGTSHFWIELSATGSEMFLRYGPLTVLMMVSVEVIEHSVYPGPPLCALVQGACVLWSRQIQEVWSSVRYAYPSQLSLPGRVASSLDSTWQRYRFWKAMRVVFNENGVMSRGLFKKHLLNRDDAIDQLVVRTPFWSVLAKPGSCGHEAEPVGIQSLPIELFHRPLDPKLSREQRFFAAQEQLAFLELELQLAKEAIHPLLDKGGRLFLRLSNTLARQGKALDRYGFVLRKMALKSRLTDESATEEAELIALFIAKFQSFFSDLDGFIRLTQTDSVVFRSELTDRLFDGPKELNEAVKQYMNKGCQNLLRAG